MATSVDGYIAAAPKATRGNLKELRRAMKTVAPEASEGISYRMPYYKYRGALPVALLKKLIKARMQQNEAGTK